MANISFENVTKQFADGTTAVSSLTLEIDDGEFMVLVGPSGSGKSTALRMVAGLEEISDGIVRIGGRVVNDMQPKDRDIAMVFQNYALFPHMTVYGNMEFGLKLKKTPKQERHAKVTEAANMLGIAELLGRKPANLSGGQRQRVAMGRAISRDPQAFLMDEPLSNLDAKLRVQTRAEVARIQQRTGTTTVYVTHDQTEALTLGDRVAVMRSGVLQQVDTPMELYNNPKNLFVAGFIGSPAMNFMPATLEGDSVKLPFETVKLPPDRAQKVRGAKGDLIAGVRPEDFEDASLVGDARDQGTTFRAHIELVESLGSELYAHFTVETDQQIESAELRELAEASGAGDVPGGGAGEIVARLSPESDVQQGQEAELWVNGSKLHLFEGTSGRALTSTDSGGGAPPATEGQSPAGHDPDAGEGPPRPRAEPSGPGSPEPPAGAVPPTGGT